jgi:hypothetical protein
MSRKTAKKNVIEKAHSRKAKVPFFCEVALYEERFCTSLDQLVSNCIANTVNLVTKYS